MQKTTKTQSYSWECRNPKSMFCKLMKTKQSQCLKFNFIDYFLYFLWNVVAIVLLYNISCDQTNLKFTRKEHIHIKFPISNDHYHLDYEVNINVQVVWSVFLSRLQHQHGLGRILNETPVLECEPVDPPSASYHNQSKYYSTLNISHSHHIWEMEKFKLQRHFTR